MCENAVECISVRGTQLKGHAKPDGEDLAKKVLQVISKIVLTVSLRIGQLVDFWKVILNS